MAQDLDQIGDPGPVGGIVGDVGLGVGEGDFDLFLDGGGRVGEENAGFGVRVGFGHFGSGFLERHDSFGGGWRWTER